MKIISYIVLFFLIFSISAFSQSKKEKQVAAAVEIFKKGIVDADKNLLSSISSEQLVYGHSNGKVQNKEEFIAEILNTQVMDYNSIELLDQTIKVSGKVAVVRHIYTGETVSNGTLGHLKIGNMLIWQKQHGKWKLMARQAYKF